MKGSYFGFGSPQQQVDMHARSKNTFISYALIFTLFAQPLPKIRSTLNFSKPLICVTLICGDWSDWSHFHLIMPVMPDKVANCCFVYSVIGETAI